MVDGRKRETQELIRLSLELDADLEQLAQTVRALERTFKEAGRGKPSLPYLLALGKLLHDFYSVMEKSLTKIAKDLNGGVPRGEDWHHRLLEQMALDFPRLRPIVLSRKFIELVLPYLRFRHIFRNLYAPQLDWGKMLPLIRGAHSVARRFGKDIRIFQRFLKGTDV